VWLSAAIVALVIGYVVARPHLERRLGIDRPAPSGDTAVRDADADRSLPSITGQRAGEANPGAASGSGEESTPFLREIRTDVFESPAGLQYGPGSEEGHRLKHIMRHARDDPGRPGPHGVFDGGQSEILALLDEAWLLARDGGPDVRTQQEDRRTIMTVNMGRRVGYVGGESGQRRGNPSASHVRLVLEGVQVITAFPLRP
jgi:hypothetical protein